MTDRIDLFSERSDAFSETWPISGTTQAGRAYARPMWAHLTDASASSSPPGLLPTPDAYAGARGGSQAPEKRQAGGHSVSLQDVAEHMLPTPQARDWKGVGPADHRRNDPGLPAIAETLLPTPRATDGTKGGPNQRGSSGDLMLPSAVHLLPTHRVSATRTGKSAALRRDSMSGPSLDQALEIARGVLPREFTSWDELPPSWHGDRTSPPSDAGND